MDTSKMKILKPFPALLAVLTVWCILWVHFIARDLYGKGNLKDYKILIKCNAEEKHGFVYGRRFFEFLKFAKNQMPVNARYELVGFKEHAIDGRRVMYYLYPRLREKNSEYILIKSDNGEYSFKKR